MWAQQPGLWHEPTLGQHSHSYSVSLALPAQLCVWASVLPEVLEPGFQHKSQKSDVGNLKIPLKGPQNRRLEWPFTTAALKHIKIARAGELCRQPNVLSLLLPPTHSSLEAGPNCPPPHLPAAHLNPTAGGFHILALCEDTALFSLNFSVSPEASWLVGLNSR